eukprot:GILI01016673.1.p1 GENE.GILI01016673.1~~GILI01016673.1.p1  ORF type:complete len:502 (+),score=59.93 GILI01016673.1:135-1640(+)
MSLSDDLISPELVQQLIKAHDEDRPVCDICFENSESSPLITCQKCGVRVHKECEGVSDLDAAVWYCSFCQVSQNFPDAKIERKCVLCPHRRGALRRTSGGDWCHVACAVWVPEVVIPPADSMAPITGFESIPPSRFSSTCSLCKFSQGICIQCAASSCGTVFHPLCGRAAGLPASVVDNNLVTFCKKHSPSSNKLPSRETVSAKFLLDRVTELLKRNKVLISDIRANQASSLPFALSLNVVLFQELNSNLSLVKQYYERLFGLNNDAVRAQQQSGVLPPNPGMMNMFGFPPTPSMPPPSLSAHMPLNIPSVNPGMFVPPHMLVNMPPMVNMSHMPAPAPTQQVIMNVNGSPQVLTPEALQALAMQNPQLAAQIASLQPLAHPPSHSAPPMMGAGDQPRFAAPSNPALSMHPSEQQMQQLQMQAAAAFPNGLPPGFVPYPMYHPDGTLTFTAAPANAVPPSAPQPDHHQMTYMSSSMPAVPGNIGVVSVSHPTPLPSMHPST